MNDKTQLRMLEKQLADNNVNHVLHLILTILTGGFWMIVWAVLIASKPSDISILHDIDRLEKKMYKFGKY